MKWINSFLLMMCFSSGLFSQEINRNGGGDDAGNGGFAYKQSIKILKLAADGLESKILSVDMPEFKDHPNWRGLLSKVLKYDNLEKSWWRSKVRNGQPLSMDYVVKQPKVIVLKHYYQSFMGKTDNEIEESVIETQKRLVHEASHIWGYNENDSEEFAERFLIYASNLATRSTKDISIKSNFCSCLNGHADIVGECESFCNKAPKTSNPILYLETVLGSETLKNPQIKSLYDWCTLQFVGDATAPQCVINAYDGINQVNNIPVSIQPNSNKLTADLSMLSFNTTYILKIVEAKTGSNAETFPIQIRRSKYRNPNNDLNAVKVSPVNQFTCLTYFGNKNSDGSMNRMIFKRDYFYYTSLQFPAPIPSNGRESSFVCHDDMMYGQVDSAMYPRLETIENKITLFDKTDSAFVMENNDYKINIVLQNRLADEFNLSMSVDLINSLSVKTSRQNNRSSILSGYFIVPFVDRSTNLAYCPSEKEYNSGEPLFTLMKDYFPELEALYVAESEPVTIEVTGNYKIFYPNQFVRESDILKNGFIVKNGIKEKVTNDSIHRNTVYFYYPFTDSMDIFVPGYRKLFTVRSLDQLNEPSLKKIVSYNTSDKRIGCIPKSNSKKDERGNRSVGDVCQSDYECQSLCCNKSTGTCRPHDLRTGQLCAKSPGEFCIDQSFCATKSMPICRLYKNGFNTDGSPKCVVRCPNVEQFGSCIDHVCRELIQENPTEFDLNTCKGAIDP